MARRSLQVLPHRGARAPRAARARACSSSSAASRRRSAWRACCAWRTRSRARRAWSSSARSPSCAHAIEDALAPFRATAGAVPRPTRRDAAARCVDADRRARGRARRAGAGAAGRAASAARRRRRAGARGRCRARCAPTSPRSTRCSTASPRRTAQLGALRRSLGALERARRLAELLIEQLGAARARRAAGGAGAASRARWPRSCGGLVGGIEQSLGRGIEQVDRELRQVRESGRAAAPAAGGAMFDVARARRRATPRESAGQARRRSRPAAATCGSTRDVLGARAGALVQVVRNAVAHGIEPEAERVAAGKPAAGTVAPGDRAPRRTACVFRCRDDGRGIDLDGGAPRRRSAGLSDTEASRARRRRAACACCCKGGISTSRTVTRCAGRGVGLDVVREVAERLGGDVARHDRGRARARRVELAVPLSLSSLEALRRRRRRSRPSAIPLDAVRQHAAPRAAGHRAHRRRRVDRCSTAQAIPFVPLRAPLRAGARRAPRRARLVGGDRRGAAGARRARRRSAARHRRPSSCGRCPTLAPRDRDRRRRVARRRGQPAAGARSGRRWSRPRARTERARARDAAPARAPVLVIDDSLTTRMLEQSILESAGYEVDLATSGEEGAREGARRGATRCSSSTSRCRAWTASPSSSARAPIPTLRDIPAILVTSRDAPEDRQRGRDVGAQRLHRQERVRSGRAARARSASWWVS